MAGSHRDAAAAAAASRLGCDVTAPLLITITPCYLIESQSVLMRVRQGDSTNDNTARSEAASSLRDVTDRNPRVDARVAIPTTTGLNGNNDTECS